MQLDAVEAGLQCVTRGTAVLVYDAGDLAGIERARHDEVLRSCRGVDLAFGGDRRRRDGRRAGWQQARMRDASGVHQLQEDQAAPRVDRVGDMRFHPSICATEWMPGVRT